MKQIQGEKQIKNVRPIRNQAILLLLLLPLCATPVRAQNWNLAIVDNAANTNANQVNGMAGSTATLYGTILNFTGTPFSDDGTGAGTPADATLLDFGGFGFIQSSGQYDLGSLFTASDTPGFPQVAGSTDGSTAGTSGYRSFGTFDLTGIAPGIYEEDFTAGAFSDDINSTVPFSDLSGTLTLNVQNPAAVPEASTATIFGISLLALTLLSVCCKWKRGQSA